MANTAEIRTNFLKRIKEGDPNLAREAMKEEKNISQKVQTYEELIMTSDKDLGPRGITARNAYLSRNDVGYTTLGQAFKAILKDGVTAEQKVAAQNSFKGLSQNKKIGVLQSKQLTGEQQKILLETLSVDERDKLIQYAMEKNNATAMMPDLFNNADPETQIRMLQNYGTKNLIFRDKKLYELEAGQKLFKEIPATSDKSPAQRQYELLSHKNIRPEVKFALFNALNPGQRGKVIAAAINADNLKFALELFNNKTENSVRPRHEKVRMLLSMMARPDSELSAEKKNLFVLELMKDMENFRYLLAGMRGDFNKHQRFLAPLTVETITTLLVKVGTEAAGRYSANPELAGQLFAAINNAEKQAKVLTTLLNSGDQKQIELAATLFAENNNLNYSEQVKVLANLSNEDAAKLFAAMDYKEDERMNWVMGMLGAHQRGGGIGGILWFFGTHFTNAEKKLKFLTDTTLSIEKKKAMFAAVSPEEQAYYLAHEDMPADLAVVLFIHAFDEKNWQDGMVYAIAVIQQVAAEDPERAQALFNSIDEKADFANDAARLEFHAELLTKLNSETQKIVFMGVGAKHKVALLKAIAEVDGYKGESEKIQELQIKLFNDLNEQPGQQAEVLVELMKGDEADQALAVMLFTEGLKNNPDQQAKALHKMYLMGEKEKCTILFKKLDGAENRAKLLQSSFLGSEVEEHWWGDITRVNYQEHINLFNSLNTANERAEILLVKGADGYILNDKMAGRLLANVDDKNEQVAFLDQALGDLQDAVAVARAQAIFREGFRDDPKRQAEILQDEKLDLEKKVILFKGLDVEQKIKVLNEMQDNPGLQLHLLTSLDDQEIADVFDKSANFFQAFIGFFGFEKERMLQNSDELFKKLADISPEKALAVIINAKHNVVYLERLEENAYTLEKVERPDGGYDTILEPKEPDFSRILNMVNCDDGEKLFAKLKDPNVITLILARLEPEKAFKCLNELSEDQLNALVSDLGNGLINLSSIARILTLSRDHESNLALLNRSEDLRNNLAITHPDAIAAVLADVEPKRAMNFLAELSENAQTAIVQANPGLIANAITAVAPKDAMKFIASLSESAQNNLAQVRPDAILNVLGKAEPKDAVRLMKNLSDPALMQLVDSNPAAIAQIALSDGVSNKDSLRLLNKLDEAQLNNLIKDPRTGAINEQALEQLNSKLLGAPFAQQMQLMSKLDGDVREALIDQSAKEMDSSFNDILKSISLGNERQAFPGYGPPKPAPSSRAANEEKEEEAARARTRAAMTPHMGHL